MGMEKLTEHHQNLVETLAGLENAQIPTASKSTHEKVRFGVNGSLLDFNYLNVIEPCLNIAIENTKGRIKRCELKMFKLLASQIDTKEGSRNE